MNLWNLRKEKDSTFLAEKRQNTYQRIIIIPCLEGYNLSLFFTFKVTRGSSNFSILKMYSSSSLYTCLYLQNMFGMSGRYLFLFRPWGPSRKIFCYSRLSVVCPAQGLASSWRSFSGWINEWMTNSEEFAQIYLMKIV